MITFGVHARTDAGLAATRADLRRCRRVSRLVVLAEPGVRSPGADAIAVADRDAAIAAMLALPDAPWIGFAAAGVRITDGAIDRMALTLGRSIGIAGPSTNVAATRQHRPDAPDESAPDAEIALYARRLARHAGMRQMVPVPALDPCCWVGRRTAVDFDGTRVCARRATAVWTPAAYVHRVAVTSAAHTAASPAACVTVAAPLVSCILPTRDRPRFVIEAVRCFLAQDHTPRELIVVDDGDQPIACLLPDDPRIVYVRVAGRRSIGEKRNVACARARGSVIAHFDDDDWYSPSRLSIQLRALSRDGADVAGSSELHVLSLRDEAEYRVSHPQAGWVAGTTLVYRRDWWQAHPFAPVMIGEDTRFIAGAPRLADVRDPDICVATIHGRNTITTRPAERFWRRGSGRARTLVGARFAAYRDAVDASTLPLISCVMPTHDRPAFVALAVAAFDAQTYPARELIVVDDGRRPVSHLVHGRHDVRYRRLARRDTIGAKRNAGHALARGEVVCSWDDDDWYSADRLRYQALPIFYGDADITGLESAFIMDLATGEVWSATDGLHATMFAGNVAGGTLAYRRTVGDRIRFPTVNLAEDAAWLRSAIAHGFRLLPLANAGRFIYMRHGHNTWRFHPGSFLDVDGWRRVAPPHGFGAPACHAYRAAAR